MIRPTELVFSLPRPNLPHSCAIAHSIGHERASRVGMTQSLIEVMRICSAAVLSYLDAGFEPRCPQKEFSTACCCCLLLAVAALLLLKCASHPGPEEGL